MPNLGSVLVYKETPTNAVTHMLLEYARQHDLPVGLLDVDNRTGVLVYSLSDAGEPHPHFPFVITTLNGMSPRRMFRTVEDAQKVATSMIRRDPSIQRLYVCQVVSLVGVAEAPIEARPWGNPVVMETQTPEVK